MRSFISTRGFGPVGLYDALFRGLAEDGGLYVPEQLTSLPASPSPSSTAAFAEVAQWLAPSLFPDVPTELLARVISRSMSFPLPLVEVERGVHVLELFHGPTCAFKDVGARFLADLMQAVDPHPRPRTVLVATSGDTGGAVAHAFHRLGGYRVAVLFPAAGISARQRRQMTTLGGNVTAVSVDGSFDDCQRLAKEAFLDVELSERLGLTSANSINIGRLLPQVFYYAYAAVQLGFATTRARFFVPSGNLGNLCAGLLAHRLGVPAKGFVAATNANRAFVDTLEGGGAAGRPPVSTDSSAMDVGRPSNLERILWLYGSRVEDLRADVAGVSVSDAAARACIADVYARTGYVLDPHSAVGYEALRRYRDTTAPNVVLATAHPAKFPEVVEAVIGRAVSLPEQLSMTAHKDEHMTEIAPTLAALRGVLDEGAPR